MPWKSRIVLVALAAFVASFPAVANADIEDCDERNNNTVAKITECVTVGGVRAHQAALQAVADANDGIRAAGTPGYGASVDYVVDALSAAGYDVELDPFEFVFVPDARLEQTTPVAATYETGAFTGSGTGTVAGQVIPVDLALADPASSTSGCEAADFAGLDFSGSADIALVQRRACFFSTKAVNAEAAGAEAVVIFNQGNTSTRLGLIVGTAEFLPNGSPSNLTIPVVGASFAAGEALAQTGAQAFTNVDPNEVRTDFNVIAELPGKNDDNVVMAGAHLDSARAGPGVQDNGSGSAALLATAVQMAKVRPHNTVRFAWWGAEELGLVGSTEYVAGLTTEEIEDIALYLNFDMIGSPNYVFFIYDRDNSDDDGAGPGPDGSAAIEEFYSDRGLPFKGTGFSAAPTTDPSSPSAYPREVCSPAPKA